MTIDDALSAVSTPAAASSIPQRGRGSSCGVLSAGIPDIRSAAAIAADYEGAAGVLPPPALGGGAVSYVHHCCVSEPFSFSPDYADCKPAFATVLPVVCGGAGICRTSPEPAKQFTVELVWMNRKTTTKTIVAHDEKEAVDLAIDCTPNFRTRGDSARVVSLEDHLGR